MNGVETKVGKTVEEYHMLEPGDRVIAAVSGGADSVCLLALLREMRTSLGLELRVVHVHHGLRGREADRDAEFVRKLCSDLDVPCHIIRVDVVGLAKEKGMSEEEAGRCLRYQVFEREAKAWEEEDGVETGMEISRQESGAQRPVQVAVAHHRDDQAETILHNIFRGSGLPGLRGIPYVRGRIIRPLLDAGKKDILEWLTAKGLPHVEDSTNSGDHYTRNRIRGHLLPWIEDEVNQGAAGNILRLGRLAGQADQYLRSQAVCWMERYVSWGGRDAVIEGEAFEEQPEIIRSYIVMELLKGLSGQGKDLGERHVQQVIELGGRPVGKEVSLPFALAARKEYGGIRIGPKDFLGEEMGMPLPQLEFETFSYEKGAEFPKKMYTKWFDCDKIGGTPVVRTRQTGDYITLSEGRTKTVNRFMIDEKIPRQMRDGIPLLADGSHVMWIIGWRISQFYKIGPDTKRVLEARAGFPDKEDCK